MVRWDVREEQAGVDTYVDIQLIDINTCEPVPEVYIDYWHCESPSRLHPVQLANRVFRQCYWGVRWCCCKW